VWGPADRTAREQIAIVRRMFGTPRRALLSVLTIFALLIVLAALAWR
jgi:hypothetical protein